MEQWKPVPGYEGYYEVSSDGRVRSLARYVPGRWGLLFVPGRMLSPAKARYLLVTLSVGGEAKTFGVHRLLCEAFHGPALTGYHAAHKDGNAHNNTVDNLYWASPKENCADRERHGKWVHGTRVNTNKLSEDDVTAIVSECRAGAARKEVAERYGVHRSTVDQLLRGDTWKHLGAHHAEQR